MSSAAPTPPTITTPHPSSLIFILFFFLSPTQRLHVAPTELLASQISYLILIILSVLSLFFHHFNLFSQFHCFCLVSFQSKVTEKGEKSFSYWQAN